MDWKETLHFQHQWLVQSFHLGCEHFWLFNILNSFASVCFNSTHLYTPITILPTMFQTDLSLKREQIKCAWKHTPGPFFLESFCASYGLTDLTLHSVRGFKKSVTAIFRNSTLFHNCQSRFIMFVGIILKWVQHITTTHRSCPIWLLHFGEIQNSSLMHKGYIPRCPVDASNYKYYWTLHMLRFFPYMHTYDSLTYKLSIVTD